MIKINNPLLVIDRKGIADKTTLLRALEFAKLHHTPYTYKNY